MIKLYEKYFDSYGCLPLNLLTVFNSKGTEKWLCSEKSIQNRQGLGYSIAIDNFCAAYSLHIIYPTKIAKKSFTSTVLQTLFLERWRQVEEQITAWDTQQVKGKAKKPEVAAKTISSRFKKT